MSSCRMWLLILETVFVFCSLLIADYAHGRSSNQIQFKMFQRRSLKDNIVQTFDVSSVLECALRCTIYFAKCKSFNYRQPGNFFDYLCEINNTTKRGPMEKHFIEDAHSIYGEIINPVFEESLPRKSESKPGVCGNEPKNGLCDSNILNGNEKFIAMLLEWLKNKTTWTLCYRASIHGWDSPLVFHPKCDFKGETVTIVSVEERKFIFGGYSDIPWGGMGQKSSSSAFLFSLRNKDALEPFMCSIRDGQEHLAVFQFIVYGPSFGEGGEELQITSLPQTFNCSANFGKVFMLPSGYILGSTETRALLGGNEYFLPSEIETYYRTDN